LEAILDSSVVTSVTFLAFFRGVSCERNVRLRSNCERQEFG
jgi:hypothetical protein